jgi:hypothetical protein
MIAAVGLSQTPYFSVIHGILGKEILIGPMRKLCLIMLASVLLVPGYALAERAAPGDGSLVVTDANARISVSGKGLIFGHLDRGSVTVVGDYKPDDNSALSSVTGAKQRIVGKNVVYTGSDVRFYFPGGRYKLIVDGVGINLSAVGNGTFSAIGRGLIDDGSYTVDGGTAQDIDFAGNVAYGKSAGDTSQALTRGKTG